VRAGENRRWLLRDNTNGFTASSDPYGRIAATMPTDIRGELDAPYAFRSDLTLYTRWGDWVAWLSILMTAVCMAAVPFARGRRRTQEGKTKGVGKRRPAHVAKG
jgi:apolipoprotein N-acyltransferase